jgi:cell division protein FtsB
MQAEARLRSASMKKKLEEREAELKAKLQRLKSRRNALKEDVKKLKRELKDLKGSKLNPVDEDDGNDNYSDNDDEKD